MDYEKWYEEKCKNMDRHTSDDTFTPPDVMAEIAEKVSKLFNFSEEKIVRPFYPGGDYQNFTYPEGCVVLDNPPFSLEKEIVKFYIDNNIKFFIFASRFVFSKISKEYINEVSIYGWDNIRYDNRVDVFTYYITNIKKGYIDISPHYFLEDRQKQRKMAHLPPNVFRDSTPPREKLFIPMSDITAYKTQSKYHVVGNCVDLKHPVDFYKI